MDGEASAFLLIPLALLFPLHQLPWLMVPLHLAVFVVTAMVCHGELARLRPPGRHLTEFYVWLAVGGALGGAFNALLAPLLFDRVLEYPLALVLACLLRPVAAGERATWRDLLVPAVLLVLCVLQMRHRDLGLPSPGMALGVALTLLPAILMYSVVARPVAFAAGMAAVIFGTLVSYDFGNVLVQKRSFFGVYRIQSNHGHHVLVHGTTIHGAQSRDPERRGEPLTYYHREGPLGELFAALAAEPPKKVGAVGLGVGSVACYRQPGQRWTFFEIDPLVEEIARDRRYFSYLADCAPDAAVVLGDARRSLEQASPEAFDLLILDAFSSDAIPIHLMTRDALALYMSRLAPHGLIAFHVSNRNLELLPVMAALVANAGLAARYQAGGEPAAKDEVYRHSAVWVVIGRREADLRGLALSPRWHKLRSEAGVPPWSDDFADLVSALRWRF